MKCDSFPENSKGACLATHVNVLTIPHSGSDVGAFQALKVLWSALTAHSACCMDVVDVVAACMSYFLLAKLKSWTVLSCCLACHHQALIRSDLPPSTSDSFVLSSGEVPASDARSTAWWCSGNLYIH